MTAHRLGRIGIATALAVGLFLAGAVAVTRGGADPSAPETAPSTPDAATLLTPAAAGSLDGAIISLQARLKAFPDDWKSFASLGLAYVQQARITADPSYYPKAEGVLQRSLDLHPQDNFEAMVGMAALAAARHDFAAALDWGERAKTVNPYNGSVYGVIGDAQVELGRYDDAFATFQTMVDTRPDLASYARVSYARELQGDVAGAIRAMKGAETFAGTQADRAWAANQLGELYFNSGRIGEAAAQYRAATQLAPEFVPPLAGLAKVAWARGDVQEAIDRYVEVTQRYPSAEYVIALGDLYESQSQTDLAQQQFDLVVTIQRLFTANGVNVDLELSLFQADQGDAPDALATARTEWGRRHSIHVADALAWALHANGRDREAARYATKALALGTQNALFEFHAGMIQLGLGDRDAARRLLQRALDTNPSFSIRYASVARTTLRSLEGGNE
jgi:tetratricopeptide (TPR) repeat protein